MMRRDSRIDQVNLPNVTKARRGGSIAAARCELSQKPPGCGRAAAMYELEITIIIADAKSGLRVRRAGPLYDFFFVILESERVSP